MKKITINLSPSDVKKSGTGFDGAMLLAVVQELLKKKLPITDDICIIATLPLHGHLLSFQSLIPTVQLAIQLGCYTHLLTTNEANNSNSFLHRYSFFYGYAYLPIIHKCNSNKFLSNI